MNEGEAYPQRESSNKLFIVLGLAIVFIVFAALIILVIGTSRDKPNDVEQVPVMPDNIISTTHGKVLKEYNIQEDSVKLTDTQNNQEILTADLETPRYNEVRPGYQKVAQFKVSPKQNANDVIDGINYYDMAKGMKQIQRDVDLKYKVMQQVEKDTFKDICETMENGTTFNCVREKTGTEMVEEEAWLPYDGNVKANEDITIGLFTEVYPLDQIEWIPTISGVEIEEWAAWIQINFRPALQDTWTQEESPTTPHGSDVDLFSLGAVGNRRNMILQFNISDLNGSVVDANLSLFANLFNSLQNTSVYYASNQTWSAATLNYNGEAGLGITGIGRNSTIVSAAPQWYVWNITNIVQHAINQGNQNLTLYLNSTGGTAGNYNQFYAAEVANVSAPYLNISFRETDFTNVSVVLTDPPNNTLFTQPTWNFTANIGNFNNHSLSNATLFVWFKNGSLALTQTNTSINYNGTFNLTYRNVALSEAAYKWDVRLFYINGTSLSTFSQNGNFTIDLFNFGDSSYTSPVTEGSTNTFIMNVTTNGNPISVGQIVYNGVAYNSTIIQINSTHYTLRRDLVAPVVGTVQNFTFFWTVTLQGGYSANSQNFTQTVVNISIGDCSQFSNLIFNFTMLEEEALVHMQNTTIEYNFNVYDLSGDNLIMSTNKTSLVNPTLVCISGAIPPGAGYALNGTVKYHANLADYRIRYYNFLNFSLTNTSVPRNITLYDVNITNSLPFLLTFRDSTLALAPDILVYNCKNYVAYNTCFNVEVPKTDSNGQTILNLIRNDEVYNFIMVNVTGHIVATFNNIVAFCQDYTIGSCSIDLSAPGVNELLYDYNDEVGISFSTTYSNSSQTIAVNFNSLNGTSKTVRVVVTTDNGFENQTICDNFLTSTTGTVSCDISGSTDSNQFFLVTIYSNGVYAGQVTIDANPSLATTGGAFGTDGYLIAMLIVFLVFMLFSNDRQVLVFMLGIGWVMIVALGLIKGALFGAASGGIWLIITIVIFIWKLKQEEVGT